MKSKMISDPDELYSFLAIPGIEVANVMYASLGIMAFHGGGTDFEITSY